MKGRLKAVIAGVAGLMAGIWFGEASMPETVAEMPKSTIFKSERRVANTDLGQERTFVLLVKRWRRSGGIPLDASRLLERSSLDEIREEMLAVAALIRPENAWRDNGKRQMILYAMGKELVKREGSAALDWSATIGSEVLMQAVAIALSEMEPENTPGYSERYQNHQAILLGLNTGVAIKGAAMLGADQLLKVEKMASVGPGNYADDFDFGTFLDRTDSSTQVENAYAAWAAADPEAAAEGLLKGIGKQSAFWEGGYASAHEGRAAMIGEAAAAEWVSGLLAQVPEIERRNYVRNLAKSGISPLRVAALLKNLPTEEDRLAFSAVAVGRVILDQSAIEAVVANTSVELRERVMQRWLESHRVGEDLQVNPQQAERLVRQLQLSDEKRREVMDQIPNGPK